MLRCTEITKRYFQRQVLTGVTFRVRPGEIVALVGANGAGKSTLIKAVLGLTDIQGGRIEIGTDAAAPGSMAARRLISYVPEQPLLYNDLTAWEHLRYVAMLHGMDPGQSAERAESLLRSLRLWHHRHLDPLEMSKGMKQKLSLASALVVSPPFLIMDEPFSGLDPLAARELRELLLAARSAGSAVLISTHLVDIAERFCDRFLLLYDGLLVGDGAAGSLRAAAGLAPAAALEDVFAELSAQRVQP